MPEETYAGKAPHVEVSTSIEAANVALDGLAKRQRLVMILVAQRGEKGMTVREFRDQEKFHHGTSSSLFTTLHMRGRLVALQEARGGATVYVVPGAENGRETRTYRRMGRKGLQGDMHGILREHRIGENNATCTCGTPGDPADKEWWPRHVTDLIMWRIL